MAAEVGMVVQETGTARPNRLLTITQAAQFLNLHPNTLRNWSNKGMIRTYRLDPRGDRRFARDDLMESWKPIGTPSLRKNRKKLLDCRPVNRFSSPVLGSPPDSHPRTATGLAS